MARVAHHLRRAAEIGGVIVAFAALCVWCSIPNVGYLADENPETTAFIELRRREAEDAGKPFKLEWRWVPLRKISPTLRDAVVSAEDIHFWTHDGVDWDAIEKAAGDDFARGGSTITQQLAKNLYLSPSRSPIRKLRELLIAYRLEDALDKDRILELYLNVVEWGDGVFGAEAAARHWFGHSAATLSPAEAVELASALPNPKRYAPGTMSPELARKFDRLLWWMRHDRVIDAAAFDAARVELGLAKAPDSAQESAPASAPPP